jgi:hypothetical protein
VRHRARPSFTVEVKRNDKRVPLTGITADTSPNEQHRLADQLLFGGRSTPASSAARSGDGGLSTRNSDPEPQRPPAEAAPSEPNAEVGRAQRLTGRILPDLVGETRAEVQVRQGLEEQAACLRSRRGARKTSPRFRSTPADTQVGDEANAGANLSSARSR